MDGACIGPSLARASAVSVDATPCSPTSSRRAYAPREPEKTALHVVVREHLETFLATVREERGKDLPYYVEQELRRYLRCGIHAFGCLLVVCPICGEEILVAYSCKCRGACPSCCARRMCGTACHLVDHVFPDVPVRQWVLTVPFEVRRVLALRPEALTACNRIFVEEITRFQKTKARVSGVRDGETGSVTFVQRFSGMLQSFVHFHVATIVTVHGGRSISSISDIVRSIFVSDDEDAVNSRRERAFSGLCRSTLATNSLRCSVPSSRRVRRSSLPRVPRSPR